jgi:hypothetical protein
VQGIACRRLLNLTELKFRISDDKFADPRTSVGDGPKSRGWNTNGGAGYLNQGADKRTARPQPDRHSDRAFHSDRPDFNGGILRHLHNQRDHSALRKINGVQGTAGLLKEVSLSNRNFAQILSKKLQILGLERSKQPILNMQAAPLPYISARSTALPQPGLSVIRQRAGELSVGRVLECGLETSGASQADPPVPSTSWPYEGTPSSSRTWERWPSFCNLPPSAGTGARVLFGGLTRTRCSSWGRGALASLSRRRGQQLADDALRSGRASCFASVHSTIFERFHDITNFPWRPFEEPR